MQLVRRIVNGQFKDVYVPAPATSAPADAAPRPRPDNRLRR